MKIKSLLLFLFCTPFLYGQITYKDLNPDLELSIDLDAFSTELLDIDGDGQDDLKFIATNYPSFSLWNLGIQQLDTLNPKVEFMVDMNISASPIGDRYIKMLSANDVVDASGTYSHDYPQIGDIYNPHFLGQGTKYIGFRLINGSDYKYGWFAVELFRIRSYAF